MAGTPRSIGISLALPTLGLWLLGGASAWAQGAGEQVERMRERTMVSYTDVPRRVLAFYYGWYATPEVTGRWSHWSNVDADGRTIGDSAHFPATGPYDSHDPELLDRHCRQAREAEIDGLIVSWWHPGDFHDRGLALLLDRAEEHGLSITAYFELVESGTRLEAAAKVSSLLGEHADHPAWLRVDGKPVLFVYGRALDQIGVEGWLWVTSEVNRRLEGGAVFIGDRISRAAARVFDGVHTYNPTGQTAGLSPPEIRAWARERWPWLNRLAPARITCATVIPGYDDTKLGRAGARPTTDRHEGETYRVLWEESIRADPDWILITSFNEWHEGSEIEPSVEHGDRELAITAELARRFRAMPPRVRAASTSDERLKALRAAFEGRSVALLPEGDSAGMWSLLAAGVPLVGLDWDEVVDPEVLTPARHPVLLYAGGEEYRATVREKDDVLRALQRYADAGGVIVFMPSGPMPMYYARGVGACEHWARLGLPLRVEWERPPAGAELELHVVRKDLWPGTPSTMPFPMRDPRWRPLRAGAGSEVEPWIRLRDRHGDDHGAAAGRVRRGEGSLVYAWFGLAELEAGEGLLLDLWTRVAAEFDG